MLAQDNGQGLAIASKAHGLSKEDFVSIFLLTNRVRNGGRMVDVANMTKAINCFSRVNETVARDILKNTIASEQ